MSDERANEPILGDERNAIGAGKVEQTRAPGGLATTAFGLSDIGCQRPVNQDTLGNRIGQFAARTGDLGLLYAIADGMGGHARGEVASAIAIHELFARYYGSDSAQEAQQALARVMIETNAAVYQAGRAAGGDTMGTTLTLVLLRDNILYVGNIGDSRTYLIRGGKIKQLSHDHSLIGEQVRSGVLTEAQARTSSIRNVITRAVGYREVVEPDTFAFTVQVGDILLLSSDGLHGLVENDELAQRLSTKSLADATADLIALARERGGPDNITALVVRIDQIGEAALADGDDRTTESFTILDDETTRPLLIIPPGQTDEIVADPSGGDSADDAETKPNPLIPGNVALSPPAAVAPTPPIAAAPPHSTAPPPAGAPPPHIAPAPARLPERQARAPIWLFILIPLVLIALVAAGAFLFAGRNANNAPETTVPSASPAAPTATVGASTAPAAGVAPSVAPTPVATVAATLSSPTATAGVSQAPLPTAASGPSGLPVLPPGTPSAAASGGTQRALVSGTIRINDGVTRPEDFPTAWGVVLYDQAEWQRQQRAAEPKARAQINSFPVGTEYTFRIDLDLPAESQTEQVFVLQVQQQGSARSATIETTALRVERGNRTTLAPVILRITGFTEESEPGPSQTPRPGGTVDQIEGMLATRTKTTA